MRLEVEGGGYKSASDAFWTANNVGASNYRTFISALSGYGSVAGSDTTAESFAKDFDPAAKSCVQAYADVIKALGNLGNLCHASGANHKAANLNSIVGEPVPIDATTPMPWGRAVQVTATTPPSVLGGDGAGPDWWHWIADHVGGYLWPDADTDKMRALGTLWDDEADRIDRLTGSVDVAIGMLRRQKSPEIASAVKTCKDVKQSLTDLATAFRSMGEASTGYGNDVDEHRKQILDELKSFIAWTIAIQAASHGLAIITVGLSELIGQSAQLAKIAAAGLKVRNILAALAIAARLRLAPVAKVATSTARISIYSTKLSAVATKMAKVRALGAVGEKTAKIVKNTKRIPSATAKGGYRIPDELDDVARVLGEVKNVKSISLTKQLKEFIDYARSQNPPYAFVLYVRKNGGTHVTGPLREYIKKYGGKIEEVL